MNLKSPVKDWKPGQRRSASLISIIFVALTPAFILRDFSLLHADLTSASIWLICLAIFVLADLLAGAMDEGLWAGYLNLSVMIAWLTLGTSAALAMLIAGVVLAGAFRLYMRGRSSQAAYTRQAVLDVLLGRMAVTGLGLLGAVFIFGILGGEIPLTAENLQLIPIGLALLMGLIMTQALGQLLSWNNAPEPIWSSSQRQRLLNELLLLLIIVPLVLIVDSAGPLVFALLMGLVGSQLIRHRQVTNTQETLLRRVKELTMLNAIGQGISDNMEMDELLPNVHKWVSRVVDVPGFYMALYDENRDLLNYRFVMLDDKRVYWPSRSLQDDPLARQVMEARATLRIDATSPEIQRDQLKLVTNTAELRAFLGIPLIAEQKAIGVMGFLAYEDIFPETVEPQTLETIANQAGLAIRNATLYDHSVRLAHNLERINQSVQDVMFNLDAENAMQAACETALRICQAQRVAIFLPDEENDHRARLVQSVGLTDLHENLYDGPIHLPDIFNATPRVVSDVALLSDRDALQELAAAGEFRAMAEVQLKSSSNIAGLMAIFHDTPHYYQSLELELLETLAYQITAALDNTELLGALEIYASEQAQLVHLSRISTSSLEPEVVIQIVTQMLRQMLDVDQVAISLMENTSEQMWMYTPGSEGEIVQHQLNRYDISEIALLYEQNPPAPRIYYRQDAVPITPALAEIMDEAGHVMTALVPMIVNGELIGVIILGSHEAVTFSDGEWRLIEMAANQIAAQLHNAQRYRHTEDALKRRLQQLALIEDLARQISSALNLENLVRNVLEAAIQATQAEVAALGLITDSGEMRIIGQEYLDGEWYKYEIARRIDKGLMGQVARSGEMMIVGNNGDMENYISSHARGTYSSSLIVPLMRDDVVIGVLDVESVQRNFFNTERIEFIKNLAGHAVISIQNARLLQERQAQIETLTRLRELSLRISSDTDRNSVAHAIARAALEIVPGQSAALYAYDETTAELSLLASLRRREGVYVNSYLVIPFEAIQQAAQRGELSVIEDVRMNEIYRSFEDLEAVNYISVILAPIKHDNQVREVLVITLPRQRPYMATDGGTVELLAIQAAGHLENAQLYERIRAGNNRMRAILDSTRDGIILLDRDGHLIEGNASAETLLNIDLADYMHRNFAETLLAELVDSTNQSNAMAEALTEMARILRLEPQRITSRSLEIHRGAKTRYIEEVGSPVLDNEHRIMGRLLTLRDVTEERLLAVYRDEISQMVVHDLRGPLTSIISSITLSLEMLAEFEDKSFADALSPLMEVSLDSGVKLLQLVDSLLDVAKLETRQLPLKRTATNVVDLVHSAFLTLSTSIQEAQVIVDQDIPADLPPVNIDVDKVRRVIINLLDNAVRFTPANSPVLISATPLYGMRKILIRIADSGPGIPPEEVEHVFEKFRQITDNVPLRGRKGIGLGLTFCKLAIEAHGETIWIEQNGPLPGACFAFTLPITITDTENERSPDLIAPVEEFSNG